MSTFEPGEIVDITIKGARVISVAHLKDCEVGVSFECDYGEYGWAIPLGPPEVTVERVSPAEWPPRPGDLWRDRYGVLWFAADVADSSETDVPEIVMVYAHEDFRRLPDECIQHGGPLTLVHREDEQGGGAS